MDQQHKLTDLIIEYIKKTIIGQESGFYKIAAKIIEHPAGKFLETKNLTNIYVVPILLKALESYFNNTYKSLVKRDDKYVIEIFDKMQSLMNHSAICLLNIIATFTANIYIEINRNNLNIESYNEYIKSFENEFTKICDKNKLSFIKCLSHNCNGEDITKLDPNIKMFTFETKFK